MKKKEKEKEKEKGWLPEGVATTPLGGGGGLRATRKGGSDHLHNLGGRAATPQPESRVTTLGLFGVAMP
jgi:hypothetical protein